MARLIDANEAVRQLQNSRVDDPTRGTAGWRIAHTVIIDILGHLPTVDAVPVVRCGKCRHWSHREDGYGDCSHPRFHLEGHPNPTMTARDFCSCGERRTDNA